MRKILVSVVVVSTAVLSAYLGIGSNDFKLAAKTDQPKTGRVLEDARTADGLYDVKALVESPCLTKERKNAFMAEDEDHDGYLTQEELDAALASDPEGKTPGAREFPGRPRPSAHDGSEPRRRPTPPGPRPAGDARRDRNQPRELSLAATSEEDATER